MIHYAEPTLVPLFGCGPIVFTYTNWRGETAERRATPVKIRFGSNEWHPEKQFLLEAIDLERQETRLFAMRDMRDVRHG